MPSCTQSSCHLAFLSVRWQLTKALPVCWAIRASRPQCETEAGVANVFLRWENRGTEVTCLIKRRAWLQLHWGFQDMAQPTVPNSLNRKAKRRPAPQTPATAPYDNATMQGKWHLPLAWWSKGKPGPHSDPSYRWPKWDSSVWPRSHDW